jgi:omega-amidase
MSTLLITSIQSDLHWEDKTANLAMFSKKINEMQERTEVIVLPEMFSTGFHLHPEIFAEKMDGGTVAWMKKIAEEKKVILTGSIIVEEEGKYYNRLIWMLPTGQFGQYDKRHRFAFAGEDEKYTAGNKRLIASVKGWKLNLQVCYDLRFPVWARQSGKEPEYDALIYVANWPESRSLAWKTLLRARAIENQCYVIAVNRIGDDGNGIHYAGDSMVIDPLGEILYQKQKVEDVFTFSMQKERLEEVRSRFPFWKDADQFLIEP